MKLKRIIATTLIFAMTTISLVGCGKDKTEPRDPRTEYFTSLQNSMNMTQGESQVVLNYEYILEDENANPMASSLIENKGRENLIITLNSLVDSSNNINTVLSLSSTELDIESLKVFDITANNKSVYINTTELFSALLTLSAKTSQLEDLDEEINPEEINTSVNAFIEAYKEQVGNYTYLMINFEELLTFITEESETEIENLENIINSYNKIITSSIDVSTKTSQVQNAIIFEAFKQVEASYETTLVQYDEENNYYYLTFNETQFIEFYNKYHEFLENNIDIMLDSYFEQIKLQDSLNQINNAFQTLANEIQKTGAEIDQAEITEVQNQFTLESMKTTIKDSIGSIFESINTEELKNTPMNITMALFNLGNGFKQIIKVESEEEKINLTINQLTTDKTVPIPTDTAYSITQLIESTLTENGLTMDMIGSSIMGSSSYEDDYICSDNWYLYDEIIVIADENISVDKMTELATKYNAVLDDSMSDTGSYLFIFEESYFEDELEEIIYELEEIEYIESAYINYPMEIETEFDMEFYDEI